MFVSSDNFKPIQAKLGRLTFSESFFLTLQSIELASRLAKYEIEFSSLPQDILSGQN